METRALFGGAITCSLPCSYTDVSTVRGVPDNQEVFADAAADASIIVELLEREGVPDEQSVLHYLCDLLESQDAEVAPGSMVPITSIRAAPGAVHEGRAPYVAGARAVAGISKFKEAARNRVLVLTAVIRLADVTTDVLLCLNVPLQLAAGSSSRGSGGVGAVEAAGMWEPAVIAASEAALLSMASSFTVLDWGLFAGERDDEDMDGAAPE